MTSGLRVAALNLDIVGTLLIAVSLILVHRRMIREKSFDRIVVKGLKTEAILVYVAIALIVASFVLLLVDEITRED